MRIGRLINRCIGSLVLLLALAGQLTAQENPVKAHVDTTSIRIGEQIEYRIEVNAEPPVVFPHFLPDSLGVLEVVESFPIDTLKNRLEKKYLLTAFDSGQFVIPRQPVTVNNLKFYTDSIRVNVMSVPVDTTKQKMYPIKSIMGEPKTFDDYRHLLWWLIPILLLIGLILYLIFRKKKEEEEIKLRIPPLEEALQRLKELDEKEWVKQEKVKEYYTELTDIVRSYIEKDTHIPALESTTNELIETITDFNASSDLGINQQIIDDLKKVLQGADLVKFAKSKPVELTIRSDRKMVEQVIIDTQSAVNEKRQKEEQERGELTTDEPQKGARKSKAKRNLLIASAVVVIAVIALSYWAYQYLREDVLPKSTQTLSEQEWFTASYGSPGMTLEAPGVLESQPVYIPDDMQNLVVEMGTYAIGDMRGDFYIGVRTMRFAEVREDYDFDAGIVGALGIMEQQLGTKFEEVEQDLRINNGVEGRLILARYAMNDPESGVLNNHVLSMLLFADDTSMRQLVITQKAVDTTAISMRNRIMESVSLDE
jgi:hypothetical protein